MNPVVLCHRDAGQIERQPLAATPRGHHTFAPSVSRDFFFSSRALRPLYPRARRAATVSAGSERVV